MRLNRLLVVNYMSFERVEYLFENNCTLIQSLNNTDASQETNGAGKTSFQSAIEYALTGNTSQKLKDVDLIRHHQDEAMIELEIKCQARQETLTIQRNIKRGKSSRVFLYLNDNVIKTATVNDSNNYISNWLAISKEDIQNYFIINRERYKNFFQTSHNDKIKIISRFTNGTLIDGVDSFVNKDVDELHNELDQFHTEANKLLGQINGYEESLNYEQNRDLVAEKNNAIEKLQSKIKEFQQKREQMEEHVVENMIKVTHANQEKAKLNDLINVESQRLSQIEISHVKEKVDSLDKKIQEASSQRSEKNEQIRLANEKLRKIRVDLSQVEKKLLGIVKCPVCQHAFHPFGEDVNIEEEKLYKGVLETSLEVCHVSLEKITTEYDALNGMVDELFKMKDQEQEEFGKIQKQINSIENIISKYKRSIAACDNEMKMLKVSNDTYLESIKEYDTQIEEIKNQIENLNDPQKNQERITDLKHKIDKAKESFINVKAKVDDHTDVIFSTGQWLTNFKQFKNYMANRFLQVISNSCNVYLSDLNSDITVRFDGYKQKVDGTLSEKITAMVIRDNMERDFNSFSGGERARLELCIILTIRDLINKSHPYGGLDFLFTDEIFEGLDGLGLTQLTSAAQKLGSCIMMTTHVSDNKIHDHILMIEKTNRISTIYAT